MLISQEILLNPLQLNNQVSELMQVVKILYFASLREIVGVAETSFEVTGEIDAASFGRR